MLFPCENKRESLGYFVIFLLSIAVPVDCVVNLAFEGVSRHPVRNNWNLPNLSRFTQPRPAYLAGNVALYTMDKLGNVRTHLSLRKLKPNNKEKNYAIYGTGSYWIFVWLTLRLC